MWIFEIAFSRALNVKPIEMCSSSRCPVRRPRLTNSETWRCPDADERERLLGFRPDHSRPATGASAKNWQLENAGLRLLFRGLQVPAAQQLVLELVNHFSLKASKISTNPGIDIIREIFRRQKHTGREVRRLGSLEHSAHCHAAHPSSVVEMQRAHAVVHTHFR